MKKLFAVLLIVFGLSAFAIFKLKKAYDFQRSEKERHYSNVEALTDSTRYYRDAWGRLAALNSGLILKVSEFEKLNIDLSDEVKKLNLKIKNLESVSRTETVFEYLTHDSVIYVSVDSYASGYDSTRRFEYSDRWITWSAVVRNCSVIDSAGFAFTSRDTITTAAEILYKRRCLFWKRPAGVRVHTVGANPYTRIDKTEYVSLKK